VLIFFLLIFSAYDSQLMRGSKEKKMRKIAEKKAGRDEPGQCVSKCSKATAISAGCRQVAGSSHQITGSIEHDSE
jgi:hypothetical protein